MEPSLWVRTLEIVSPEFGRGEAIALGKPLPLVIRFRTGSMAGVKLQGGISGESLQ